METLNLHRQTFNSCRRLKKEGSSSIFRFWITWSLLQKAITALQMKVSLKGKTPFFGIKTEEDIEVLPALASFCSWVFSFTICSRSSRFSSLQAGWWVLTSFRLASHSWGVKYILVFNHLALYLKFLFGDEVASLLLEKYCVGTSKKWNDAGATVFWQRDIHNNISTGKIMLYSPAIGKRKPLER